MWDNIEYTKTSLSLYFWMNFNNLYTILTRIFLKLWFFIQIQKFEYCSWISIVFKVQNQNWLLFGQFLSDFKDWHLILNRIVSQIWTCFKNQYLTIVGQTAMILVSLVVCTLWPFYLEGRRWYYNGPLPMALGLIWPSLCHQNQRFSTNVVLFARFYLT